MPHLMSFWQTKAEAIRSLIFDKPEGGAVPYRPTDDPQHFQHVKLPNGVTLMVPVNVTVAEVEASDA